MPRETLDPALDQLRMGGLIELTPWVAGLGQGYALTPSGRALLRNPRGLERLSRGELPRPAIDVERAEPFVRRANSDRWLQVKDAVLSSRPAIVSLILGGICVFVFLWGYILAAREGIGPAFLTGFLGRDQAKTSGVLDRT